MNDLEFVQRCAKGDKQSWNLFIERYSRLIYNYIHSVLKIKGILPNPDNLQDIFQEIFVALTANDFRKLKTFQARNGSSLASWLRQVTINHTIDHIRKFRVNLSLEEENEDGLALQEIIPDKAESALDKLSRDDLFGQLKDCISQLTTAERYFLELHIDKDMALEELKGHLGISRAAADMRKSRIVGKLRDCFKHKGLVLDS